METVFPSDKAYKGLFVVGVRKDPNSQATTQRTGTVILKRTYDIDPVVGTLSPSATPLDVFMRDQPDNLLVNSDFESELLDDEGKPIDWHPEGVTIIQTIDPDDSDKHFLQVSGAANGRVVQTLIFEEPLGGRGFWFSFLARADNIPARVENIRLEADGSPPICVINADLTTVMNRLSVSGVWPADLTAAEMRVVLRMATDDERTVFYDKVQVEERDYETVWDPATTLRYEHDLAAFKPEGDVIALGFAGVAGISRIWVNGTEWLERNVTPPVLPQKAVFGWESRVESDRKAEAGTFDPPPGDTLPADFDNRFYNGYRRTNTDEGITAHTPFPYLPADAQIEIERVQDSDYRFTLRGDTVAATYYYYDDTGPDQENNWQSEPVTMNLDTLVIEPEKNRCYVVWRGVWPFDNHPEGAYRRLVVEASA